MIQVGQMIEIGAGATWGGSFLVLEIIKTFANGKIAVAVDFHGKRKVFHI